MAGDPSLEASRACALGCVAGGATILEIGMPFSDPIADGPTLQRANERALKGGTSVGDCLATAAAIRKACDVPIVLMGYLNPVLTFGEARFFRACRAAGVDGVILPDLPPEEANSICRHAKANGVATVFMLAPTSTPARIEAARAAATGFIYLVSVTGVTGARQSLPAELPNLIRKVRTGNPLPVVVGFGVSTPEQVRAIGRHADGVVVGSAIVRRAAMPGTTSQRAKRVKRFVATLKKGIGS